MKLISSIFFLVFFIASYAQAESTLQTESTPKTKPTLQVESIQAETEQKKTNIFSLSLGGEVSLSDNFAYNTSTMDITFGGITSKQSFFQAGVKLYTNDIGASLFTLRYGYSFIEGRQWVPGVDISLLAGARYSYFNNKHKFILGGGFELGSYLKIFISKSHALVLRTGITYATNTESDFDLTDSKAYLNLGIQWHF